MPGLKRFLITGLALIIVASGTNSTLASKARIAIVGAIPDASEDGKVPPWQGGLPVQPKADNGHHKDPYADESPLFTIDHNNYEKHQPYLTEGLIAMLKAYPESFRVPVYPGHRSATYPDFIYENTRKNAPADLIANGNGIANPVAGINFPEPENGLQAIWNHLTRWRGRYMERQYSEAKVYADGNWVLTRARQEVAFEIYRPNQSASNNIMLHYLSSITEPARLAGGALLVIDFLNQKAHPRKAWSYDASQRRVKRLPYISYDSPAILAESLRTTDDTDMFNGAPDRFAWHLRGREIKYIPYNSYRMSSPATSMKELLTPNHLNPDFLRYEAHRVWVVDALLKSSEYHIYTKRTFYIDEDSWSIAAVDQYDQQGKIWRVSLAFLKNYYEIPATFSAGDVYHDLKTRNYHAGGLTNASRSSGTFEDSMPPKGYFSPSTLRNRAR